MEEFVEIRRIVKFETNRANRIEVKGAESLLFL